FSSRRRHTSSKRDWSSDVCSSYLIVLQLIFPLMQLIYCFFAKVETLFLQLIRHQLRKNIALLHLKFAISFVLITDLLHFSMNLLQSSESLPHLFVQVEQL